MDAISSFADHVVATKLTHMPGSAVDAASATVRDIFQKLSGVLADLLDAAASIKFPSQCFNGWGHDGDLLGECGSESRQDFRWVALRKS